MRMISIIKTNSKMKRFLKIKTTSKMKMALKMKITTKITTWLN